MTISRPGTGMARASTTWATAGGDGRLAIFLVGVDVAGAQALWHIRQTAPGGWSPWSFLGLPSGSAGLRWSPAVVADAEGRLQVFIVGDDLQPGGTGSGGALYQRVQASPGGGFAEWVSRRTGGPDLCGSPSVGRGPDGRLQLFALGSDAELWHTWQTDAGWSEWFSRGSPGGLALNSAPAVAASADGHLEVFIVSQEAALWHIRQTSGGWSQWSCHATPTGVLFGSDSTPAIAPGSDGCLQLFTVGNDGTLWQISQKPADGGWSSAKPLDAPSGTRFQRLRPAVGLDREGRLHVFGLGDDDELWHRWQTGLDGGWSPWSSRGAPPVAGLAGSAATVPGADGLLELFVAGTDGGLWHIGQAAPDGGWSEWYSHGAPPGFVLLGALTTG